MNYHHSDARKISFKYSWLAPALLLCVLLTPANRANAAGLEWTIAPYLFGPDLTADVTVNAGPEVPVAVPFSDLVSKLDMAFMGHVEARGEKFGGFFDMIYMDISDSTTKSFGPGEILPSEVLIDTSVNLQIYEFGGLYRIGAPTPGTAAFDLLLGGRQIELKQDILLSELGPVEGETEFVPLDTSETDVFAGVRIVGLFNERWGYKARADYGTGGTNGTVNALATVGYTFGESGLFTLDVGYRYMKIKLDDVKSDLISTNTELTAAGPLVGFIFTF
jgi:hypothetical protein